MTVGDFELGAGHQPLSPDEERALEDAAILVADELGVSPHDITDDEIIEAYRLHGFADWSPEVAERAVRALAHKGFEHI